MTTTSEWPCPRCGGIIRMIGFDPVQDAGGLLTCNHCDAVLAIQANGGPSDTGRTETGAEKIRQSEALLRLAQLRRRLS